MPRLRLRVLGAAAGGGVPQWNCHCRVCSLAWAGDPRVARRTQSSLAVTVDGDRWALLNCAPEILAQLAAAPELQPRDGLRHSPIAAVLVTNGDIDHVAGLLSLREGQPFRLFGAAAVLGVLARNPVFDVLAPGVVAREAVEIGRRFELLPGLEAELFAVPGKTALYLERGEVEIGVEDGSTVGVELRADGRRAVYVPGCARMTPALAARLAGADAVLFDGTLWDDEEMIREGVGSKTGWRMGHMAMSGPEGSIAAFASLGVGRRIFVHINNTNPVLIEGSPERAEAERAGWTIAHDGLEVTP